MGLLGPEGVNAPGQATTAEAETRREGPPSNALIAGERLGKSHYVGTCSLADISH